MELNDGYVPIALFGPDHWSTLAYAETVMVDCGGFQAGFDPRMRTCRAHFRVQQRDCPHPRRTGKAGAQMWGGWDDKHSTRLADGSVVRGHDDWHCVQDLFAADILRADLDDGRPATEVESGLILHLTDFGARLVAQLRAHKAGKGTWATFTPDLQQLAA